MMPNSSRLEDSDGSEDSPIPNTLLKNSLKPSKNSFQNKLKIAPKPNLFWTWSLEPFKPSFHKFFWRVPLFWEHPKFRGIPLFWDNPRVKSCIRSSRTIYPERFERNLADPESGLIWARLRKRVRPGTSGIWRTRNSGLSRVRLQ